MSEPLSTGEKVWRWSPAGLEESFVRAHQLEEGGDLLSANIVRASACVSFASDMNHPLQSWRNFRLAKQFARTAARLAVRRDMKGVTHGQCDVIGTILLRRWLWHLGNPRLALKFFDKGLNCKCATPHSRALLHVGAAEARFRLGFKDAAIRCLADALALEDRILDEEDQLQAHRQLTRIFRRGSALAWKLGDRKLARSLHYKARDVAYYDSATSQREIGRLEAQWAQLHFRKWWHLLLPA